MKRFRPWVVLSAALLVLLTFACKKDLTIAPVEPSIDSQVTVGYKTVVCSAIVHYPGKLEVVMEWGLQNNMENIERQAMERVDDSTYTTTLSGLSYSRTYYYRVLISNSFMSIRSPLGEFTTLKYYTVPKLTTAEVTDIEWNKAKGGGEITDSGNAAIQERGVCWSTSHNPTVSGSHASSGSGTGSFTVTMTGLEPSTTYYVRAYAVNGNGTGYGNEVSFMTADGPVLPEGSVNGLFSVSASQQVFFSQGNLQYQASTNTWRFAEHQYDYIGDANSNISSSYSDWIDLFGWGTSGWNSGAVCYQPWSTSKSYSDYYPGGSYTNNLTGSYANADWGVYNAISNGGNTANTWRTLTKGEWEYAFNTRTTLSGIRYAKACVNNVNGVILLPDDWSTSTYSLSNTNSISAGFTSNTITASQWVKLEDAGAVFLPAAGARYVTSVYYVGSYGTYWSASYNGEGGAYYVNFGDSNLSPQDYDSRHCGLSVRLVRDAQ